MKMSQKSKERPSRDKLRLDMLALEYGVFIDKRTTCFRKGNQGHSAA